MPGRALEFRKHVLCKCLQVVAIACFLISLLCGQAYAEASLRIPLPKRTKPTPVQKLNREGVKAIDHREYRKAEKLFYQAYLLDPNDPFTLNNLGYISELQGDVDRAQRYYEFARQNASGAVVDKSNLRLLEGRPFSDVVRGIEDGHLQVNRFNEQALLLLSHGRTLEAENLLRQALAQDPKNPFTLNNLGFAKEKEGELKEAIGYYQQAAELHSNDPVIVTLNQSWRGRPISKVAAQNAKAAERGLNRRETAEEHVARLNLRGVSALNRNDPDAARRYFAQAYKLDPGNAFTLNNMGYLSELDGDRETADEFYANARAAEGARDTVTLSTQRDMQGLRMGVVADINDQKVENKIEAAAEIRRRMGGPIQLKRRNGTPVTEPEPVPPAPPGAEAAPPTPQAPSTVEPQQQMPRPPSPYSPQPPQLPSPELPGSQTAPQPQQQPPPQTQPPPSNVRQQQLPL